MLRTEQPDLFESIYRPPPAALAKVKKIADSVTAFQTPDDALCASIEMQLAIPELNHRLAGLDIAIRTGLHAGSSFVVTLSDRLDYFGEAVNLAARLAGQETGGDIIMSKAFTGDPAVSSMLSNYEQHAQEPRLKDFDDVVAIRLIRPQTDNEKES